MLKNWIKHDILKFCHDLYQNFWFLIKKKFNQYCIINAAMNMNKIIIRDINLFSDVNEFFKEFVDMIMIFLIDLFSEYNQITLTKIYQDLTMFMTSLRLLQQMMLLQDVINFVAQFVRVIIKILKNLLKICRSFLNDIEVKRPKIIYDNAEITSEVHQFMLKHIKNLNFVLLNFELINCIISDEKLQFCMSSINRLIIKLSFNINLLTQLEYSISIFWLNSNTQFQHSDSIWYQFQVNTWFKFSTWLVKKSNMMSRELNIEIFPIFRLCIIFLIKNHKEKHEEKHEDCLIESFDRRLW